MEAWLWGLHFHLPLLLDCHVVGGFSSPHTCALCSASPPTMKNGVGHLWPNSTKTLIRKINFSSFNCSCQVFLLTAVKKLTNKCSKE